MARVAASRIFRKTGRCHHLPSIGVVAIMIDADNCYGTMELISYHPAVTSLREPANGRDDHSL